MDGIYEQESARASDHHEEQIAQRRLWTAVLVQAVEDWRSNNVRRQREAEEFLFQSQEDFERVCAGAGLDSSHLRAKLLRIKPRVQQQPAFLLRRAA